MEYCIETFASSEFDKYKTVKSSPRLREQIKEQEGKIDDLKDELDKREQIDELRQAALDRKFREDVVSKLCKKFKNLKVVEEYKNGATFITGSKRAPINLDKKFRVFFEEDRVQVRYYNPKRNYEEVITIDSTFDNLYDFVELLGFERKK